MIAPRTWSMTIAGAVAALLFSACTNSEESTPAPAPPPAAPSPPQQAPGQPPAAKASAIPLIIDELYVDAEAEPDEGTPPLIVSFTSIVEDYTGKYECEWDFGDGSPKSKELNPRHTYEKEGDFIVVLNCKDEKGIEGETEIDVTVYQYE